MPRSFDSVFYGAAGTSTGGPPDDEFNRVSFLSHFDGANNGVNNAFDDGSTSNHTITANGNVTQGSFGPFARPDGEWGVDTSGGWTYWGYNVASTGALGDEDFCMECFVFINSFAAKQGIASRNFSGTGIGNETWRWEVQTNGTMTMISKNFFGQDAAGLTSSTALTLNTWHHVAAVRQNDTLTFYIDGTARGATSSGSGVFSASNSMWNIGSNGYQTSNSTSLQGTMSNFRLVVGSAVYTGNFTAPSSKLTAITNTEMLAYQNNRFVDNSAGGNSLALVSEPAVTAFGPFLTSSVYDAAVNGASAYFDGNGDRLHTPEDASTRVAASNFTFEAWVYSTTTTTSQKMIFTQGAPGVYAPFNVYVQGTTVRIYISTNGSSWNIASNSTSSNPVQVKAWNHISLVRNGTTIGLYINGVADNTYAVSTTAFFTPTRETSVGGRDGEEYFPGYITDARLVIGTAVYTSAFTPPTAPLTAITNTKLLLNMADGQAIDSAAQNNLSLGGTVNISTDQAKFGNTSLHLAGSNRGDHTADIIDPKTIGKADFTIEGFYRFVSFNNQQNLFDFRTAGNSALPMLYFNNGSNELIYYVSAGARITYSIDFAADTWYHVALCRSGTSTKLFVDGTQGGSTYSDSTSYVSTPNCRIGSTSYNDGSVPLNGFCDDFRISHMARYTSNFTVPDAAFPDKGQ